MTFARIKDERIEFLSDGTETRQVLGFSLDGLLLTKLGAIYLTTWVESEIKEWEAV
jgi:hypothetical protein